MSKTPLYEPGAPLHHPASNTIEHPEFFSLLTGQLDLSPPAPRKIFVNRTLRLDRIDWIGFDMDYTLVRYRSETMEPLLYQMARNKLKEAGYPDEIDAFVYHPQRAMRGILIDRERGNLLQMNQHRHVQTAYLGHRLLDKEARRQYRIDPLQFSDRDQRRFRLIDAQFGVPEACLYADIIEWKLQTRPHEEINFLQIYEDVRTAMDGAHADKSVHKAIQADLSRYLLADPELATTLQRFRMWGKKLFLLTNSDWEYTAAAMSHLLNEQLPEMPLWTNYFDLVLVHACKPSFFHNTQSEVPFELLNEHGSVIEISHELRKTPFARGGNQRSLHGYLGVVGERVLYVGDHIYGDILQTKKSSTWRTMLIIEELERELQQRESIGALLAQWETFEQQRDQLDAALHHQTILLERIQHWHKQSTPPSSQVTLQDHFYAASARLAEREIQRLQCELNEVIQKSSALHEQIHAHFNPFWGMLFHEGHAASSLAEQVRKFACLYTSRVSNFLYYTPTQYFRPPRILLPHEAELPPLTSREP